MKKVTTYVLSQHASYWHITRYTDDQSEPLGKSDSEEAALEAILKRAMADRPSQILRINLNGNSHVVAKLEDEKFDLEQLEASGIKLSPKLLATLREDRGTLKIKKG